MNITLTPEVRAVLEKSHITETSLMLPAVQLERKLYDAVNKVIAAAGGKWDRKAKAHIFPNDPRPKLGMATESGFILKETVVDEKKLYQAFYTPQELAERMVDMAGIVEGGMRVLEPSAGMGAIANAVRKKRVEPYCIELDPIAAKHLCVQLGFLVMENDFLKVEPCDFCGLFDAIVMNPPFTKDQDIRHVMHALKFLKPGGVLVAIMAPGFTFGETKIRKEFREFLAENGTMWMLPENTFKESGTSVRTVLISIRKAR